jgi:DNA-directed RNA polymerase subunit RPC12/RpoP
MYFQHPLKCTRCGLHFTVASYNEDWPDGNENAAFCPECGERKLIQWEPRKIDKEIFEDIPGNQPVVVVV